MIMHSSLWFLFKWAWWMSSKIRWVICHENRRRGGVAVTLLGSRDLGDRSRSGSGSLRSQLRGGEPVHACRCSWACTSRWPSPCSRRLYSRSWRWVASEVSCRTSRTGCPSGTTGIWARSRAPGRNCIGAPLRISSCTCRPRQPRFWFRWLIYLSVPQRNLLTGIFQQILN